MRKAAYLSIAFGFAVTALMFIPVACGSSAAHPGSLVGDSDGGIVSDAPNNNIDVAEAAPPPEGGPTTVSISSGDAGSVTDIRFGDNGFVNCGASATSVPVTISNTGTSSLKWSAKLSAGAAFYTLSPVEGTVNAGQSAIMQVIPQAVPATSAVTPDLYGGVVIIQTSASNDTTHVIQLHQTARGVILTSTLGNGFNFNSQAVAQSAQSTFSMTNVGNVAAAVKLGVAGPVFSVSPATFTIDPSVPKAPVITFTPPIASGYTDTLITSIDTSGGGTPVALCGPLPVNALLQGAGDNSVFISPTNLDFGLTICGGLAAPSQNFQLQNKGAGITFTYAFAKAAASPYTLTQTGGTPGSVGAGLTQSFMIASNAIPKPSRTDANFFGDTLTITTNDGSGPKLHTITLSQTARGAVLQYAPNAISTGGPAGASQFAGFSVTNVGNYQGTFRLGDGSAVGAISQPGVDGGTPTWSSNVFAGNLVGGAFVPGTLTVTNPPKGVQTLGHITLTIQPNASGNPTILCADAPPDLELSATGN